MGLKTNEDELPIRQVALLDAETAEQRWMVRNIWGQGDVGILGGHPKAGKSWLGLELAISVASGKPFLGHFVVDKPGAALLYLAEDSLPAVRARVGSICEARKLAMRDLDLHAITSPSLRLDQEADQGRLARTLARRKPRLLVLDPLVRLHRLDENSAQEISGLLGYLREMQRTYEVAILLVHHARKRTAETPGEALRGSSDLYAWTDVAAHLARQADQRLLLRIEHRSAASLEPMPLQLVSRPDGTATHLELLEKPPTEQPAVARTLEAIVLDFVTQSKTPPTTEAIRAGVNVQKQRVVRALAELGRQGRVTRDALGKGGWVHIVKTSSQLPDNDGQQRLPLTVSPPFGSNLPSQKSSLLPS